MSWLSLSFVTPWALLALLSLPVIWWLLRMTPPSPQVEVFPPLKILAQIMKREEVSSKSPWWLTLLRLIIASLIIFALATPVLNPSLIAFSNNSPIAIVMDNGWASAPNWAERTKAAEKLIIDARSANAPIYLAATAEPTNAQIGPFDGNEALKRLHGLQPRPIAGDRKAAVERLAATLPKQVNIAILSDGIVQADDAAQFATLDRLAAGNAVIWYRSDLNPILALTKVENKASSLELTAVRPDNITASRHLTALAFDDKGRKIADAALNFAIGSTEAVARFELPVELRNDFRSIKIEGIEQAGATRLIDAGAERRNIGLITMGEGALAQPLLSPLHYISSALSPFANLIEPKGADLLKTIPQLLDSNPSIVVMADIGTVPAPVQQRLQKWVDQGGILLRFAGPNMAGATENDTLLPVRLRQGQRRLGGAMSWSEPQKLREFPAKSPFGGIAIPDDLTVSRQVLAEPSLQLNDRTYAVLQDGTPLVTGERRGRGHLILFHITPDADWSNLPLSGTFIEMMRRLITLSQRNSSFNNGSETTLPPYKSLSAFGALTMPDPDAKPLIVAPDRPAMASIQTPPGFYGNEDGQKALNLFEADAQLRAMAQPAMTSPLRALLYGDDQSVQLRGYLLAAAALLFTLDALLVMWMQGKFAGWRSWRSRAACLLAAFGLAAMLANLPFASHALAQTLATASDAKPGDEKFVDHVSKTHMAYVITGNKETDRISEAGLRGLNIIVADRTSLEPGAPVGVDLARDELAFFPIIYWPIGADAAMPSPEAIARADAYMSHGGTILFDTQDQLAIGASADGAASPAQERLRAILDQMNVPPLEKVPENHVLTKSFYIMRDFPGRFEGSPLWVAATAPSGTVSQADRSVVNPGDGVSPIIITANDFAGAWAVGDNNDPLLPTVPNDPMQRVYAERGGVNIMMYMLTGNYKSDQVHVNSLLERLGN